MPLNLVLHPSKQLRVFLSPLNGILQVGIQSIQSLIALEPCKHSQILHLPTLAGNDLLSDFERYGGFHLSIAQVPLSDTFIMSRGGRVGSEIINDYVVESELNII